MIGREISHRCNAIDSASLILTERRPDNTFRKNYCFEKILLCPIAEKKVYYVDFLSFDFCAKTTQIITPVNISNTAIISAWVG